MMKRERCEMYHKLAARACSAVSRLGVVEERPATILDDSDPSAYLALFQQITEMLEVTRVSLDNTVEEECRELLGSAGMLIYSNILRVHPDFDLADMLDDLAAPLDEKLSAKVRKYVEALQKAYSRVDEPAAPEGPGGGSSDNSGDAAEGSTAA
jgi:hypothetical protein